MRSITLANPADQDAVRRALPSSNIYAAAVARLYIARPNIDQWIYSGFWGAIVFCEDRNRNNSYFIRIVDIENGKKVIWEQEFFIGFFYLKQTDYFYTFDTDDYLAGLEFAHEGEAISFFKKLVFLKTQRFGNESDKRLAKQFQHSHTWTEKTYILKKAKEINNILPKNLHQIQSILQKHKGNKKAISKASISKDNFSHTQTIQHSKESNSLNQTPIPALHKLVPPPVKPLPLVPFQ